MIKTIQAIRIFCGSEIAANPALGIYSASGKTEIRFSEDTVPGSTLAYTAGFISKGGIGPVQEGADLRRGGEMVSLQGIDITLRNAEQLFLTLKSAGVNLQGCAAEIHEYEWNATAHPAPVESDGTLSNAIMFTGVVEDIQWDALGLTLKLKNSRCRRNAFIGTIIDNGNYADASQIIADIQNGNVRGNFPFAKNEQNGKIVPCTFGAFEFDGKNGAPAKLLRTASAVVPLVINGSRPDEDGHYRTVLGHQDASGNHKPAGCDPATADIQWAVDHGETPPDYGDLSAFPVAGTTGSGDKVVTYTIRIAPGTSAWQVRYYTGSAWSAWSNYTNTGAGLSYFDGQYLTAIDGTQNGNGREISLATFTPQAPGMVTVTIAATCYFTRDDGTREKLQANTGTAQQMGDTWVQIQRKYQEYRADMWPGRGRR